RTTAKAFAKDVFIDQERKLGARRRSVTFLVPTINDADQESADVAFRTLPVPYEKSKSLGSGGSIVASGRCKTWGASPIGATVGADLGGSSKYSSENFEGRREKRFHVNVTCTWGPREELFFLFNGLSTLEPAQPEVGSSSQKSTACCVVSGAPPAALKNLEDRVLSAPGRTYNRIRSPSCSHGESGSLRADRGTDWERLPRGASPGDEQSTQNSALNVKVKKFNEARVNSGSNYDSLK
ncbi:hypothetical protein J1N35_037420, partial [Gossypium stocksii]